MNTFLMDIFWRVTDTGTKIKLLYGCHTSEKESSLMINTALENQPEWVGSE